MPYKKPFVDLYIIPHYNAPHFPMVREKNIRELAKSLASDVYAIDDDSAISWEDGKTKIVSEGDALHLQKP